MTIYDFPTGLLPLIDDASGCAFAEDVLQARAPGGRGVVQIIRQGTRGRWRQSLSLNLSHAEWRSLEQRLAQLAGGEHQLRAPDLYQAADRHFNGWTADAPISSDGLYTSDGEGVRAVSAPTVTISGDHVAADRTVAAAVSGQRHLVLAAGDRISIADRLDQLTDDFDVGTGTTGTLTLRRGLLAAVTSGTSVMTETPRSLWLVASLSEQFLPRSRRLVTLELEEDLR